MKNQLKGFMDFVRLQGVIGLAVGLAVGTAAGTAVKAIVEGFINPIVGFILGGADLGSKSWHTGLKNGGSELVFGWGSIASSLIVLMATAAVIYYVVHGLRLDRLDKKEAKELEKKLEKVELTKKDKK